MEALDLSNEDLRGEADEGKPDSASLTTIEVELDFDAGPTASRVSHVRLVPDADDEAPIIPQAIPERTRKGRKQQRRLAARAELQRRAGGWHLTETARQVFLLECMVRTLIHPHHFLVSPKAGMSPIQLAFMQATSIDLIRVMIASNIDAMNRKLHQKGLASNVESLFCRMSRVQRRGGIVEERRIRFFAHGRRASNVADGADAEERGWDSYDLTPDGEDLVLALRRRLRRSNIGRFLQEMDGRYQTVPIRKELLAALIGRVGCDPIRGAAVVAAMRFDCKKPHMILREAIGVDVLDAIANNSLERERLPFLLNELRYDLLLQNNGRARRFIERIMPSEAARIKEPDQSGEVSES